MIIKGLQDSNAIREHLNELMFDIKKSNNKKMVRDFIIYWKAKYMIALDEERSIKEFKLLTIKLK